MRFLPLSLAMFFTAAIAGRHTTKVPTRLLIADSMRDYRPAASWF